MLGLIPKHQLCEREIERERDLSPKTLMSLNPGPYVAVCGGSRVVDYTLNPNPKPKAPNSATKTKAHHLRLVPWRRLAGITAGACRQFDFDFIALVYYGSCGSCGLVPHSAEPGPRL